MLARDPPRDGKSESGAVSSTPRGVSAKKSLKYAGHVLFADSDARVAHDERRSLVEGWRQRANGSRQHDLAGSILDAMDETRLYRCAEVGKGRIGGNEIERLHR
jgi:hypothetical protein